MGVSPKVQAVRKTYTPVAVNFTKAQRRELDNVLALFVEAREPGASMGHLVRDLTMRGLAAFKADLAAELAGDVS